MAVGGVITTNGKNVMLNRTYKSSPDYTTPSVFSLGIGLTTPVAADTAVEIRVPIEDGTTNDDGSNTLTGSSGGANSTNNTTTFKQGGGNSDVTAQNLIANDTNVNKIWTIADLSSAGTNMTAAEPMAYWLYIKDATALAKIVSVTVRLGSDASNYHYQTTLVANLAVGWNWITSETTNVEDLTETGTVAGNIDTFVLVIVTNNATDTFVAGDVVYDLLRQWAAADLIKIFSSGYPTFDEVNQVVTIRAHLTSIQANGFDLSEFAVLNTDGTPKLTSHDVITAESKSDTDEFIFIIEDELI